jgi:hypothetical protein
LSRARVLEAPLRGAEWDVCRAGCVRGASSSSAIMGKRAFLLSLSNLGFWCIMVKTRQRELSETDEDTGSWTDAKRTRKVVSKDGPMIEYNKTVEEVDAEHEMILTQQVICGSADEETSINEAFMTFNKYCTLNKLKEEIKMEIESMDRAKATYLRDFEFKRKAMWKKFYKLRDEQFKTEEKMNTQSTKPRSPEYEAKIKMEVLGPDEDDSPM